MNERWEQRQCNEHSDVRNLNYHANKSYRSDIIYIFRRIIELWATMNKLSEYSLWNGWDLFYTILSNVYPRKHIDDINGSTMFENHLDDDLTWMNRIL